MKKILFFALMLLCCVGASAQTYKISGKINHTKWIKPSPIMGQSTVTFSAFPTNVEEFQKAQEVLGLEPQGAVVLQLMAMELYRHDKVAGEECLKMVNTDTNLPGVLRRLKEILLSDDSYGRPYLVATFLQGATPKNGYNPKNPYQVKVRVHPVNQYQGSNSLRGLVLFLQVYSDGYDTPWRGVEVVKQKGDTYYRVSNCPSMYTQCKEISWETDAEFNGFPEFKE